MKKDRLLLVKDRAPVLIFGGTPRTILTIAHSLKRRSIHCSVADLHLSPVLRASRALDTLVELPASEPDDTLRVLKQTITQLGADMLIPCNDVAIRLVAHSYDSLRQLCHPGCPPPEVLDNVLDKRKTVDVALQCGINVPKTWQIPDVDCRATLAALPLPLIIKPRFAGKPALYKTRLIKNYEQFVALYADPVFPDLNVMQEFCPGEGVGIELLMVSGRSLIAFQHRRVKEWPASGGVGVIVESQAVETTLAQYATTLLRTIGWEGIAMVEFRRDPRTGVAKLMEINGRFWGSLPVAVESGVDFPYAYWQYVHGCLTDSHTKYNRGVRVRWSGGDIFRLTDLLLTGSTDGKKPLGRLKELASFVSDWNPKIKSALFKITDPKPAMVDFTLAARSFAVSMVKKAIPRATRHRLSEMRSLMPRPRLNYVKLWVLRALHLRQDTLPSGEMTWHKILFVCRGNRIRSPYAKALFQKLASTENLDVYAESAGTHAIVGKAVDARALLAANEQDVRLDGHTARPLSDVIADAADAVFVMDYVNEAEALSILRRNRSKVYLLGSAQESREKDVGIVADPDRGTVEDVRLAYAWIARRVRYLVGRLTGRDNRQVI